MPTHGSLTKAGKVRAQTPKIERGTRQTIQRGYSAVEKKASAEEEDPSKPKPANT